MAIFKQKSLDCFTSIYYKEMGYERSTKSPQKCACFCSTKICYPGIAVSLNSLNLMVALLNPLVKSACQNQSLIQMFMTNRL